MQQFQEGNVDDYFQFFSQIWEMEHSASAEDLRPKVEDDSQYPDIPKNWGFMTLKRNRKK